MRGTNMRLELIEALITEPSPHAGNEQFDDSGTDVLGGAIPACGERTEIVGGAGGNYLEPSPHAGNEQWSQVHHRCEVRAIPACGERTETDLRVSLRSRRFRRFLAESASRFLRENDPAAAALPPVGAG